MTSAEVSKKISLLQQKAKKTTVDSTFYYLQEADKLIQQHPTISDSLHAENLLELGLYYISTNDLKKASEYFYKATKVQKDSIINLRQFYQYFVAFETFKSLGKYGDCKTLTDSFKQKINLENLQNGLYFLEIQTEKGRIREKVILQK